MSIMLIMKRLIGIIILTLLFVISVDAQSQRPIPSAGGLGSKEKAQLLEIKKHSENNQRGTEQSPFVVKVAPSPNAQEEAAEAKKEKYEKVAANRRSEIITIAIAVATFLQAFALIITIIIMIRTTRRQLRAYNFVDKLFIGNVAHPVLPLGVKSDKTAAAITRPLEGPLAYLEFKNSGQTPAYDVISWGDICIREFPLTSALPTKKPEGPWIAKASIPPGGGTNKHIGIEKPLIDNDIDKLRAFPPTAAIYVYGSILYKDTFGKIRTTNYRFFHNSLSGILGQHTGMSICDEGNEAD